MEKLSLYDKLNLNGIRLLSEQLKKNPEETMILAEDLKSKYCVHKLSNTSLFIITFVYKDYRFFKYFDL
jgi:hypothetical protein